MRRGKLVRNTVVTIVVVRVALAVWAAAWHTYGDFSATLPGGYARTLNPVLWDSPDLKHSWAFHQNTYLHGPVQYLTLYPIVFLDSYRQIAWLLLPVYALVLWLTFRTMLASLALLTHSQALRLPVLASTFLFFPVLQAYVQREFEVVVLLAMVVALRFLIQDRREAAAAILAYAAWFKYVPLIFVFYLALRRWVKALAVFVLVSVAILGLAHAAFGLRNFFNNNVPTIAMRALTFSSTGFCAVDPWNTTLANVRYGLCRLEAHLQWQFARDVYLFLCGLIAAIYLTAHWRLSHRTLDWPAERWRRALELSIVTAIYSCFFFGHYYYLSALIVPLNVLLARYLVIPARRRFLAWGAAYFLLSAFVVPTGLLARVTHVNVWQLYMQGTIYLYGELLLVFLLLWEYWILANPRLSAAEGSSGHFEGAAVDAR